MPKIYHLWTTNYSWAAITHQIQEDNLESLQGDRQGRDNGNRQVDDLTNVGSQKEGDKLLNVCIDLAPLLDGGNNCAEVVIQKHHAARA